VVTPEETQTSNTSKLKHVKTRNGYQIVASDGVIAGFARPENTLILRLQLRRSIGDLTKGEPKARSERQRSTSGDLVGPQTPNHL
jgi:hypothetical protein